MNGGRSSIGLEFTIISLIKYPKILRLGGLTVSNIEKILKKDLNLKLYSSKILSPGQMKIHYSPGIPIRLNIKKPKKWGVLIIKKRKKFKKNIYHLSKKGSLKEAAKNLYSTLRKIKKDKFKSIAVERIKNQGLGRTINDRLLRASRFYG